LIQNKKWIINILSLGIIFVFLFIPLGISWAYKSEAPIAIMESQWEAGDALGYVAGSLAFLGTMFLGFVAWKQNNDLQTLEKHNFIANNDCKVVIKGMQIRIQNTIPVNHEIHSEQILVSAELEENEKFLGIDIIFNLEPINSIYAEMVHVDSVDFFISDEKHNITRVFMFFKEQYSNYTRIAISKNELSFSTTILVRLEENKKILENINNENTVGIDIMFKLLTNSGVLTKCKCRAKLEGIEYDDNARYNSFICSKDSVPRIFWYGNEIINPCEIDIAGEL